MFKVGDKVECIDTSYNDGLKRNHVYTVSKAKMAGLLLEY